jgi:hypothetical protein
VLYNSGAQFSAQNYGWQQNPSRVSARSRFGSSADVDAPLNDVRRHIDSEHSPAVRPGPLGAINRDAGADFEQTINDEFH